jgi:hypothetical protein
MPMEPGSRCDMKTYPSHWLVSCVLLTGLWLNSCAPSPVLLVSLPPTLPPASQPDLNLKIKSPRNGELFVLESWGLYLGVGMSVHSDYEGKMDFTVYVNGKSRVSWSQYPFAPGIMEAGIGSPESLYFNAPGEAYLQVKVVQAGLTAVSKAVRICVLGADALGYNLEDSFGYEGSCTLAPPAPLDTELADHRPTIVDAALSPSSFTFQTYAPPDFAVADHCSLSAGALSVTAEIDDPKDYVAFVKFYEPLYSEAKLLMLNRIGTTPAGLKIFSGTIPDFGEQAGKYQIYMQKSWGHYDTNPLNMEIVAMDSGGHALDYRKLGLPLVPCGILKSKGIVVVPPAVEPGPIQAVPFCVDKGRNQGGVNLTYPPGANLNVDITGNLLAGCTAAGTDPRTCWGPASAQFNVQLCTDPSQPASCTTYQESLGACPVPKPVGPVPTFCPNC